MQMQTQKGLPFVSVCTPTFNRRPFIPTMMECFRNQTYPARQMEWIIIDDGTDHIKDLIVKSAIPQIRYFSMKKKMKLGEKRNFMHSKCRGEILVYMDDDDFYPPERVEHAVQSIQENPQAMCAGSSEIYIYFKHISKMIKFGPYGPNHASAGTFAFRRQLLETCSYDNGACLAEERHFLKDYTIPMVQLNPLKTILVVSHNHNTFDKKRLLDEPNAQFLQKESALQIKDFIKSDSIYRFFMYDIDGLLENYEAGEPKLKPDVLEQMAELTETRKKIELEHRQQQQQQQAAILTIQQPNLPPIKLNIEQIVKILGQNEETIHNMYCQIQELKQYIEHMHEHFILSKI